ncbi:hypothetical protein [Sphingobacterium sp. FBM7-1]|nr:hypothetical protein [Sphingobacterium sp. FBM7-1]
MKTLSAESEGLVQPHIPMLIPEPSSNRTRGFSSLNEQLVKA